MSLSLPTSSSSTSSGFELKLSQVGINLSCSRFVLSDSSLLRVQVRSRISFLSALLLENSRLFT